MEGETEKQTETERQSDRYKERDTQKETESYGIRCKGHNALTNLMPDTKGRLEEMGRGRGEKKGRQEEGKGGADEVSSTRG